MLIVPVEKIAKINRDPKKATSPSPQKKRDNASFSLFLQNEIQLLIKKEIK